MEDVECMNIMGIYCETIGCVQDGQHEEEQYVRGITGCVDQILRRRRTEGSIQGVNGMIQISRLITGSQKGSHDHKRSQAYIQDFPISGFYVWLAWVGLKLQALSSAGSHLYGPARTIVGRCRDQLYHLEGCNCRFTRVISKEMALSSVVQ